MINSRLYTHQLLYLAHLSSKRLHLVLPSELPCFFVAHFYQGVGNIPQHFAPYWHESNAELLQISRLLLWWLEVTGGRWAHCNGPETSVGCCDLILLGAAIRRWSTGVMKGQTWSATIFREAAGLKLDQSSCGSWDDKRHIHNQRHMHN